MLSVRMCMKDQTNANYFYSQQNTSVRIVVMETTESNFLHTYETVNLYRVSILMSVRSHCVCKWTLLHSMLAQGNRFTCSCRVIYRQTVDRSDLIFVSLHRLRIYICIYFLEGQSSLVLPRLYLNSCEWFIAYNQVFYVDMILF